VTPGPSKECLAAELLHNTPLNREFFCLDFTWSGPAPRAGQFFMIRPKRTAVFLGRPVSIALWDPAEPAPGSGPRRRRKKSPAEIKFRVTNTVRFLIARRGKGTEELGDLRVGEFAELSGPLGNAWGDFVPPEPGPAALIGGGAGIASLAAFAAELPPESFDVYAGFKTGFSGPRERMGFLGPAGFYAKETVVATEDGSEGKHGRIPDFLDPAAYRGVYACGPEPMLKAVAASCKAAGVPCFISMERRMACGTGACLGCTVETSAGGKRCCADGPIFNGEEVVFDE
jgi:NAD(P)H-flavin reductase